VSAALPNTRELRRSALIERLGLLGLVAPALLLILVTMLLPVGWLFYLSVLSDTGAFSLEHYQRMWVHPSYGRTFWTTFQVSFQTTAICTLLGYPLAYFLSEIPKRAANLCMIAVLLPLWTSLLVRTYAWLVLLQRRGLVNSWGIELGLWDEPLALVHNLAGTLIGMVHVMLPFLVLPLYSAMRAIDRNYLRAAANLGASPLRSFWLVFFPLAMPGLVTGALIVFILCLGFYVTPAVLGGGKVIMVSSRIANDIEIFFNWGAASALGVVLLVLTVVLILAAGRLVRMDRVLGGEGK
jgi:putative spermidine/putrescine transport system permease protein/spermidine/putrescine transport system permease protein